MSEFPVDDLQQTTFLDRPLSTVMRLDWEKAIYLAFILIAIVSRFYMLGDRAVSHDESLHTQYSFQYYEGNGYSHTPLMHGPFLFHATAASYWLFGDSDYSSRIPVAILGIILVVMPYLMRDWLGRKGALFASFFLLISPYIVYYSRYIRHDIYVIVWAMITFIATLYYQRDQQDKYLWWFAAGIALMFATKEVSFMYVAIFGSFLIVRALAQLGQQTWAKGDLSVLRVPIAVVVLGVAILGGGFFGVQATSEGDGSAEITHSEPVAADPSAALSDSAALSSVDVAHAAQVAGLIVASIGLFLVLRSLRSRLNGIPEYDLIVLYAALVLPTTSALLSVMAGVNPLSYDLNACTLPNQASMSPVSLFFARAFNANCLSTFLGSSIVINTFFLIFLLVAGLFLGYWWGGRRFIMPAIVFHIFFGLFYTSLFTNNAGWYSGMVESLGYWLEQQEVKRGGQPAFYYLFVTPFYEFLPILFSLFGIRLWMAQKHLSRTLGYWLGVLLTAYIGFSFSNWLVNRPVGGAGFDTRSNLIVGLFVVAAVGVQAYRQVAANEDKGLATLANGMTFAALLAVLAGVAHLPIDGSVVDPVTGVPTPREASSLIGAIVALLTLALGAVYFFTARRAQIAAIEEDISWRERFNPDTLTGFMPHLIWWLVLTWAAYSYAGEKMPWLSTHIVIPTALIAGWYMGEKVKDVSAETFFSGRSLRLILVASIVMLVAVLTTQTTLIEIDFGDQSAANLTKTGLLFGRIATLAGFVYLFARLASTATKAQRQRAWLFAGFLLLSALTIRFTYMANYVNGDYSTEYLVYAHGSPATKNQVMRQLDEISMRLEGDKSIRVSFDNKSSWPYYWYLREYDNQHFFGENPDATITESPVIISGSDNWEAVENIIRDDYEATTYSYIWWPMERYRDISWTSIFGISSDPNAERGLGSRQVREALWDIFLYRDYENYGNVFGGNYSVGSWPLRGDLKMYIRKDVLSTLWDSGVTAAVYTPPVDPYAEGEVTVSAELSLGGFGQADGQFDRPRNLTVSPDGRIFVADTGNHRIQVFNPDGSFAYTFGEPAAPETAPLPSQFNEPWGITSDAQFVYVADTWNGRIQKFTLDGAFVATFGTFAIPSAGSEGALEFYGPRSIAVNGDNLYIMDTGNHRIQVVDVNGNYVDQVGTNGFGLGQFNEPVGLTIDQNGTIYVAEAWAKRIQSLDLDLNAFYEWEIDAWDGNSLDNKPYITTDGNNRIYATDPEGHQVLIFNAIGEYLGRFGRFGTGLDGLDLPTGIATDANNNVYVADTNNHRILKFAPIDLTAGN